MWRVLLPHFLKNATDILSISDSQPGILHSPVISCNIPRIRGDVT